MTNVAKKTLLMFGGFLLIVGLVFLVANLVFRRPNHHNEARWGVVHIQMDTLGADGWSQHHVDVARSVLPELNRLGPTFVIGGDGDHAVRVVSVDLTDPTTGQCNARNGVGRFVTNNLTHDSHIEIDPTCTHGDDEFRTVLMHEVGHFLGMQHVCGVDDHLTPQCSPVGRGIAVMNPSIVVDDPGDLWEPGPDGTYHTPEFPEPCFQIQPLDVKEFERVHPQGHL